jgi:hypothetical protein
VVVEIAFFHPTIGEAVHQWGDEAVPDIEF